MVLKLTQFIPAGSVINLFNSCCIKVNAANPDNGFKMLSREQNSVFIVIRIFLLTTFFEYIEQALSRDHEEDTYSKGCLT